MSGFGGRVSLVGLHKAYAGVPAVKGIDLEVPGGQFFSLLGASGCGKTTTLRMIAGFEKPDAGQILLDGTDLSTQPPHARPVNTVFQSYALFPHLSVAENVGFGLKYQKVTKEVAGARIRSALEMAQMQSFADRRPAQLSGGQQQRVALARALVLNPRVLLLDEPLGALDAQLRQQLQLELRRLQREVGITFVYVTHDQEEALTMSDQIAVLADGRIEQVGAPQEVYSAPATAYVAGFLGTANIFDADVLEVSEGVATCRALGTVIHAVLDVDRPRGEAAIVVRPERVWLHGETEVISTDHRANVLRGRVSDVVYLGAATRIHVALDAGPTLVVEVANHSGPASLRYPAGSVVQCVCPRDAVRVLRRSSAGASLSPEVASEPVAAPEPAPAGRTPSRSGARGRE